MPWWTRSSQTVGESLVRRWIKLVPHPHVPQTRRAGQVRSSARHTSRLVWTHKHSGPKHDGTKAGRTQSRTRTTHNARPCAPGPLPWLWLAAARRSLLQCSKGRPSETIHLGSGAIAPERQRLSLNGSQVTDALESRAQNQSLSRPTHRELKTAKGPQPKPKPDSLSPDLRPSLSRPDPTLTLTLTTLAARRLRAAQRCTI